MEARREVQMANGEFRTADMMNYLEMLKLALPETFVVLAAFAALLVDMVSVREQPLRYRAAVVGGFACVGGSHCLDSGRAALRRGCRRHVRGGSPDTTA